MRFTFACLNLQCGIGMTRGYWQYATSAWKYLLPHSRAWIDKASDFILSERIDVICCCEVEGASLRSGFVDYAEAIAKRTGMQHRFFETHRIGKLVRQGNSIHSRFPSADARSHRLPGRGEPRFLVDAVIQINGTAVSVFGTHLSLNAGARGAQIAAIAALIKLRNGPALLSGDFNTENTRELAPIADAGFRSAGTAATSPSWAPRRQIDHIFARRDVGLENLRAAAHAKVSDHLPLVVEAAFDCGQNEGR
jgi:endonuclease/exonuclease/phosphatase family metal-dependent hydrolase